ncbi:MAG: DUF1161 domain-containing protein [Rubrivivax sp.]|nr:DUF1161 domain-containing protein [Rubrivivax sp.]
MRTLQALAALLVAAASGSAGAVTCEELVASIEGRIRANGVASFTVVAVDLAASAPGKQVGTCGGGRKKIMYLRAIEPAPLPAGAGAGGSASAPAGGASKPGVITECADGRVIREGSCRK